MLNLFTRALAPNSVSLPLPQPGATPPATFRQPTPQEIERAHADLFRGIDVGSSSPGVPDSSGIWAGSGEHEMNIDESTLSGRENVMAYMGRTDARFEAVMNEIKNMKSQVMELWSFHRANQNTRGM